jgi:hypothetical protein
VVLHPVESPLRDALGETLMNLNTMTNRRMAEKIENGEAIDVSKCPKDGRYYRLDEFLEDHDYCDAEREVWIWSIGQHRSDDVIHASTSSDLYQNPDYHCLFLR